MDINEKIKYWIDLADYDTVIANDLFVKGRNLYVGYFCHLFIEKILKGYFCYAKNVDPPYTHNLIRLAELSGIMSILDDKQIKLLNKLMPLNIEARYPKDKDLISLQLTDKVIKDIFTQSLELKSWIQNLIK